MLTSRWTTTARVYPRNAGKKPSVRFTGWTRAAICKAADRGWVLPSRAISSAPMAAILCWTTAPWAAFAQLFACPSRFSAKPFDEIVSTPEIAVERGHGCRQILSVIEPYRHGTRHHQRKAH